MLAEIEQLQNEPVQSNVDPSPTKPAPPPVSDYTTMEFFHQVMPHASIATAVAQVQPGRQNDIELSTMATLKGPKSGPVNVTYSNVTKTSAVINWSKEFSHTTAVPLFEADTDEKDADSLHIIEESSVMLAEIEQLQNEPVQSNVDPSPTKPAPPPVSDYTTMEFFHQVMPHASIATAVAQVQPGRQNDIELSTMATLKGMTALDYLKQTLCNVYSNTTTAGNDTIETVM
ncbi:hypothetical protein EOD39_13480 [Acipenser ruthenus]|uniref:Uncharacterized protein n=1 Tax=Acipenser ruthenus TaxID=7906 RepID=A0A662YQD0_ACIRT|nr:hypothetical protein EOD39_13480 [Acipenser ruthenus]